jgi:hypothetical protein
MMEVAAYIERRRELREILTGSDDDDWLRYGDPSQPEPL